MRNSLLTTTFLTIITLHSIHAQQNGVSIGITKPDESAILHVQSDADPKGLLIPRYDEEARDNINSDGDGPAEGLIIYNTDDNVFNYFDGSNWLTLIPSPANLNLNMADHKITNLADGTADDDAVNKGQLDDVDDANLNRSGNEAMTGNLSMGNNRITNLGSGTGDNDAVTKGQYDDQFEGESGDGKKIVDWGNIQNRGYRTLANGSIYIGDVSGDDDFFSITHNIGHTNYLVFLTVYLGSGLDEATANLNNDIFATIYNKTNTTFSVAMREVSGVEQFLTLDWMIVSTIE